MKIVDMPPGLCMTCIHVADCCSVHGSRTPVIQCELFDCGSTGCPPAATRQSRASSPTSYGDFVGLCMNCDDRAECSLPRPEGGVWHCEEYS